MCNNNYFYKVSEANLLLSTFLDSNRNSKRFQLKGLPYKSSFRVGDILEVVTFKNNLPFIFEGICLSVRKKSFVSPEVAFLIRNIILGVVIEVSYSYYYNRLYNLRMNDYKKKKLGFIRKSKIYFLRFRTNRESIVR